MEDEFVLRIPRSVLNAARSPEEVGTLVQQAAAIEYYLHEDASVGYCAHIAGMGIVDFIALLGEHQIGIFDWMTGEDLERDIEAADVCCKQATEARQGWDEAG